MPIYEYACLDCKQKFEVLRPMSEADAPIHCTKCDSIHTARTIAVFFANSGGKVLASGSVNCSTCSATSCATCRPQ